MQHDPYVLALESGPFRHLCGIKPHHVLRCAVDGAAVRVAVAVIPPQGMKEVESNYPDTEGVYANHDDLEMGWSGDGEGDVHNDDTHDEESCDANLPKPPRLIVSDAATEWLPGLLISVCEHGASFVGNVNTINNAYSFCNDL